MADFLGRFTIFALVHSLFATRHIQARVEQQSGGLFRWYRLAYNVLSTALFAWVLTAWRHPPMLFIVSPPLNFLLRIVQASALVLLVTCAGQVGMGNFLGINQLRGISRDPHLVTTGCYAHSRHPQYLLAILFLAANPLMTYKWMALTLAATLYFILGAIIEERRMRIEFGDEYVLYRQRVPMFIPRIRGNCR